jgi:hypothetical protein
LQALLQHLLLLLVEQALSCHLLRLLLQGAALG